MCLERPPSPHLHSTSSSTAEEAGRLRSSPTTAASTARAAQARASSTLGRRATVEDARRLRSVASLRRWSGRLCAGHFCCRHFLAGSKSTPPSMYLVHGWDKIENIHFYSLLGLSTKMLPNYDKGTASPHKRHPWRHSSSARCHSRPSQSAGLWPTCKYLSKQAFFSR